MKKIRVITCLLAVVLAAAAFTGCGDTSVKEADASPQQGQDQPEPQKERGSIAKVTSLEGDQLIVVLGDMPEGGRGDAPMPNGTSPAIGAPSGNGQPPTSGSAVDGSGPPAGGPGQHEPGGDITFNGKEVTYTLSGDVVIMKGMGETAAEIDLSELAVNDVIRFTTITEGEGHEVIDSIRVIE